MFVGPIPPSAKLGSDLSALAARTKAALLPLVDGKVQLEQARTLPPSFAGDGIVVVAGQDLNPADAPFTLRVSAVDVGDDGAADSGCALARPSAPGSGGVLILAVLGGLLARSRRARKDA